MNTPLRTMTVGKLRRLLEAEDDDALVIFTANYGDFHRTQQALPIFGRIEEARIEKSAYSTSGFALVDDEDSEDDGNQQYLVIR